MRYDLLVRKSFSLSPKVKAAFPGEDRRNQLCNDLTLYYQDALFATEEEPVTVSMNGSKFDLFPSRKDARKIRVNLKETK